MAAPKEKLPSIGHLTNMERKTFTKQRDHCLTNSEVRQLQQRWHELNEQELRAQQHNKELLQQFEKAEKTLKEMLACTAAMKTIRIEYERYLKESSPRWQQQLKEKTQAAQRMRMEDRSCLKNTKETEVTKAYADQRSQDKDAQNIHSDDKQHGSSYRPYVQTSWLTHPQSQTAEFPMRATHQPQSSSHIPPSFLPHPHPFVLHYFTPTPSHHLWPRQNAPGWSSLQTDCPWTAHAAGLPEALWSQLYNEEPPPELMVSQTVAQRPETSGASGSKSDRCGGRRTSRLSQELDVKPVRLSSGHAESSESGRDSSQVFRERRKKKEKRGRSQCTSSEKESHGSEESSRTSSAAVIASAEVAQGSETGVSSGKSSIKSSKKSKSGNRMQVAKSVRIEKVPTENNRNRGDESANQRASGESGRQTEESTGQNTCINTHLKSITGDEKQKQIISSEQSSSEEKDEDDEPEIDLVQNNAEEKENSLEDDYQDGDVEEEETEPEEINKSLKEQHKEDEEEAGEVSAEKKTTEEEETAAEDEMEEQEYEVKDELKNDGCNKRSSASSQDEEDEREQDKTEDEEVSDEKEHRESEEEQMSDKEREPEEESDSEDGIISPKENSPKGRHIIPEEAAEDDNEKMGTQTGTTDGDASKDFSEDDDIENLLAPQELRKKRQDKDLKAAEKPKVSDMKIFQVEGNRLVTSHSDSDEFDHFYD